MLSGATEFRASLRLLATRRFGTFWFASLLSSIGTWAQQVAEPWLLLTMGASSFVIGLDSFASNAPVWLLTLAGGALADRWDRRRVIAWFQSIQMLCPLAIVVLLLAGALEPWMIIVLSLVVGVTDALSMPSFQSIVPSIVERDQIGRGLALNSTQFSLSRILGPSIAGVLMASAGAVACFVVSVVSYLPFIGIALWILPRWKPPTAAQAPQHFRHTAASMTALLREPHSGIAMTVSSTAANTFVVGHRESARARSDGESLLARDAGWHLDGGAAHRRVGQFDWRQAGAVTQRPDCNLGPGGNRVEVAPSDGSSSPSAGGDSGSSVTPSASTENVVKGPPNSSVVMPSTSSE